MKKKILITILVICLIIQGSILSVRYYQNKPKDFSKVDTVAFATDFRFYYNHLTENGKIAYTIIMNALENFPEKIEIPELTDEEYDDMFLALSYDNPTLLSLNNTSEMRTLGKHFFFIPAYRLSQEESKKQQQELQNKVNEILKGISSNMSDFEKELYFHDYICEHTVYDDRPPIGYTAYDTLVLGNSVCEGYARAMQLLLTRVNIPNYLITGKSRELAENNSNETVGHMWNIVEINGKKYHLDTTWDDVGEHRKDYYQHNYFNLTQKEIQRNHTDLFPLDNDCAYTEHNYFSQKNTAFSSYNDFTRQRIVEIMREAIQKQSYIFEIKFTNFSAYDTGKKALVEKGELFKLLKKADKTFYRQCKDISYINVDALGTIQVIMKKEK